jgi:hypothetical protein
MQRVTIMVQPGIYPDLVEYHRRIASLLEAMEQGRGMEELLVKFNFEEHKIGRSLTFAKWATSIIRGFEALRQPGWTKFPGTPKEEDMVVRTSAKLTFAIRNLRQTSQEGVVLIQDAFHHLLEHLAVSEDLALTDFCWYDTELLQDLDDKMEYLCMLQGDYGAVIADMTKIVQPPRPRYVRAPLLRNWKDGVLIGGIATIAAPLLVPLAVPFGELLGVAEVRDLVTRSKYKGQSLKLRLLDR